MSLQELLTILQDVVKVLQIAVAALETLHPGISERPADQLLTTPQHKQQ